MKTNHITTTIRFLALLFVISVIGINCNKKEDPNMVPDPVLKNDYRGTLKVSSTNTLPPWSVSTTMDVYIEKELGTITIDPGTLSYSGDTIIQESSRLERTGQWQMYPIGTLMEDASHKYIKVDAQVNVVNDVQRIYAKDNDGNWLLVNEVTFNEAPYSVVDFDFAEAETSGSVSGITVATGSITWTLIISPE